MLVPGTKLGPYDVLSPLGAGGMGEVYRARDTRLGREVAVKVLPYSLSSDPERVRRFEQEARAASMLNHPNILVIYDIGTHDGAAYVVSELLEGETLRDRLSGAALPLRKAIEYALQVARGLAAAHEKGIAHRDLKPENIFITKDGRVKILDFGLAKLTQAEVIEADKSRAPTISGGTEPGIILGTVGYMSPEQARGQVADHRADIFSFGAILYEMLSGLRAFKRDTAAETMTAIMKEEPPELSGAAPNIPPTLAQVVGHCLEKGPEQRFQSARDLEFALATLSGSSVSGIVQKPVAGLRPRMRLRPLFIGLAALAVFSLAAFLGGRKTASGPSSRPVKFRPLTFRQGNLTAARFGPDGHNIVYSAFWDGRSVDLYMSSLESPESRSLGLVHSGLFAVSSSGEMAIALGCELNWSFCTGKLARVPLTGGAPREVLDNVSNADWSPDGQTLAVAHVSGGRFRLEYPIGKVLYEAPGWIGSVRVSPKGDMVAFSDSPVLGEAGGSVCVVDLEGRKKTLSSGWTTLLGLSWSPSGDEVWFTAGKKSRIGDQGVLGVSLTGRERIVLPAVGDLRLEDVSKDGTMLLTSAHGGSRMVYFATGATEENKFYWFDWSTAADLSRDGMTLLFYEWGDAVGGTPTAYLAKTTSSDAVRLGDGKPLALSPTGAWALAVGRTSPPQLVLLPTGVGQPKLLPRGALSEFFLGGWFPDGHRIFFSGAERGHPPHTFVQDVDSGDPQPATSEGTVAALLSPDGKTFAVVDRYGEYSLIPVEGGETRPIDGLAPGDQLLQWSSDGRALFVRASADMELKIFRLDLSSGRREIWKDLKPPDPVGLIGIPTDPGQVRITPDGKHYVYTYWTYLNQLYTVSGIK